MLNKECNSSFKLWNLGSKYPHLCVPTYWPRGSYRNHFSRGLTRIAFSKILTVPWQISFMDKPLPKLINYLTSLIKLAVAHIQIHQLSPGLGAAQILSFQFHLCWPVMSQKLPPSSFQDNSLQDVGLSTNLAQTLWVRSWLHL